MVIATLTGYVVLSFAASLYVTDQTSFLIVWVAHGVLSGAYFTSAASLGQHLFPHSKYAQFASAALIFTSLTGMTLAPIVGLIIDQTGGVFRYCFAIGSLMSLVALVCAAYVHSKFMRLGGPTAYTAPE